MSEAVKPGYKQTEVGVIPEEWNYSNIGSIATKIGSGVTPTGGNKVYQSHGVPFVRSQNIGWGNLILDDVAYISKDIHLSFVATEIIKDDVLLNITGASIGRCAKADSTIIGGNVNQHVCIVRVSKNTVNADFLKFFVLSNYGQLQIDSFQAGGNRQGLNFVQVGSMVLPLPPLPEQRAIASALADMDALLDSLEELLTKKRQLKQAAMQELLTGKTRLEGFEGEWEEKTVADLCAQIIDYRGRTPLKMGMEWGSGDIAALSAGNVKMGFVDFDAECYLGSEKLYKRWMTAGELEKGDIIFTTEAPLGNVALIPDGKKYILSQRVIALKIRRLIFDNAFLLQKILSTEFQELLMTNSSGSTAQGIKRKVFEKLVLFIPCLPEQKAIAAILSEMDAELEALEERVAKTRDLKEGMMQELLTGRTRLL